AVACDAGIVDEHVQIARLLDETRGVIRARHVCLNGKATRLLRDCIDLVLTRAVTEDDLRASAGQLDGDRPPDSARRARDEAALSRQRADRRLCHAEASVSSSPSSAATLLTGIALTVLSMRRTRPESTFPGPTSTNVRTPSRTSALAACVKRTGAVS